MIRLRVLERYEPLGSVVVGSESSLGMCRSSLPGSRRLISFILIALLNKKQLPAGAVPNALDHAQIDGPGVILAYMSSDKTFVSPHSSVDDSV